MAKFSDQWMQKWQTLWEASLNDTGKNKIRLLLDNGMVLFFSYKNEIYGTQEPSRVTFAKLRDPNDEDSVAWRQEATFTATNLFQAVQGKTSQVIFGVKDIPEIKVITNKDDVYNILVKFIENA